MKDYVSMASALYDSGWRSEDKDQLVSEYDLFEDDVNEICYWLKEFELDEICDYDGNSLY